MIYNQDPFTTRLPSWRSHALPTSCWSSSLSATLPPAKLGEDLKFIQTKTFAMKMLPQKVGAAAKDGGVQASDRRSAESLSCHAVTEGVFTINNNYQKQ